MKNEIKYEWTIELIEAEHGDIIDSDFSDTFKGLPKWEAGAGKIDIGLVRDSGDEVNGLQDRLWAYVKNGKLPEYFSNAEGNETSYKVPKKYHTQLLAR